MASRIRAPRFPCADADFDAVRHELSTPRRAGEQRPRRPRAIPRRNRYTPGFVVAAEDSGKVVVDARGLKCPVNWAKAKTVLEAVGTGTLVEVLVDDPRSERDLPAAAEAEGHAVLEVEAVSLAGAVAAHLRILIEK